MLAALRNKDYRSEEERLFSGSIAPDPEYRSEEEILFASSSPDPELDRMLNSGTTFAGTGRVCRESLTPFPEKAKRLREQKYW